jgi:hypothetical protein
VKANLSPLELQYFRSYDKLLNKYCRTGGGGVGLDLTADPAPPDDPYVQVQFLLAARHPAWLEVSYLRLRMGCGYASLTSVFDPWAVQVRVLRDYNDVVFSSGKVSLQCGKSHWLPSDEVHPLVMDGVLELVGSGGNS